MTANIANNGGSRTAIIKRNARDGIGKLALRSKGDIYRADTGAMGIEVACNAEV